MMPCCSSWAQQNQATQRKPFDVPPLALLKATTANTQAMIAEAPKDDAPGGGMGSGGMGGMDM